MVICTLLSSHTKALPEELKFKKPQTMEAKDNFIPGFVLWFLFSEILYNIEVALKN